MSLKLSIVVPIYNCGKYLRQCIDSILNQTYANIELILVDDGSTDASGAICDTYAQKDERIKVIHKNNEGLLKARLSGAKQAVGEYITFVDGDDWIAPDTYEQMMKHMDGHDMVMAGIYRYFTADRIKADIPMLAEGIYDRDAIEQSILPYMLWSGKRNTWELDPSLCTKIMKKSVFMGFLENAGNLDIYFGEDTAVIFPFMLRARSMVIMYDCFYYHRQRSKGMIPSYFQDKCFFEKLFSLYGFLKNEFSQSVYWELLSPQLEHFYVNAVRLKQQSFSDYRETEEDIFPFWDMRKGANVVLYGAGETGRRFYRQNEQYHFCNIVLWADRNYKKLATDDQQIVSPQRIAVETFDYIIIAVRSAEIVQEIVEMFTELGIPREKIIWNNVLIRKVMMDGADRK